MTTLQQDFRRIGLLLLATVLVLGLVSTLVLATDVVFLIFLGVLFGLFLTKTSQLAGQLVPISYAWRLGLLISLLLALLVGSSMLFAGKIESRLDEVSGHLDKSSDALEAWLSRHPTARNAVRRIPYLGNMLIDDQRPRGSSDQSARSNSEGQNTFSGATLPESSASLVKSATGRALSAFKSVFYTSLGLIVNVGMIFFIGVFVAADPQLYRDGTIKLFPIDKRSRVCDVMNMMGDAMFSWLIGRFFTMLITGVGTAVALWGLGVPMPFTIGIVTGLLTFIPNIGGLLALILAMLMALTQGPMTVAWVVIAYGALQLVESNVITPLVQQHQTAIPPALLIGFQVVLGALTGFIGLMVATPMLAAAKVLVQEAWIKDTLGDQK